MRLTDEWNLLIVYVHNDVLSFLIDLNDLNAVKHLFFDCDDYFSFMSAQM